jgi:hypothetical protein
VRKALAVKSLHLCGRHLCAAPTCCKSANGNKQMSAFPFCEIALKGDTQ